MVHFPRNLDWNLKGGDKVLSRTFVDRWAALCFPIYHFRFRFQTHICLPLLRLLITGHNYQNGYKMFFCQHISGVDDPVGLNFNVVFVPRIKLIIPIEQRNVYQAKRNNTFRREFLFYVRNSIKFEFEWILVSFDLLRKLFLSSECVHQVICLFINLIKIIFILDL